jgi:hypothetical protein
MSSVPSPPSDSRSITITRSCPLNHSLKPSSHHASRITTDCAARYDYPGSICVSSRSNGRRTQARTLAMAPDETNVPLVKSCPGHACQRYIDTAICQAVLTVLNLPPSLSDPPTSNLDPASDRYRLLDRRPSFPPSHHLASLILNADRLSPLPNGLLFRSTGQCESISPRPANRVRDGNASFDKGASRVTKPLPPHLSSGPAVLH